MRMRRVIPSTVACPALLYFPTLSHKQQDFLGWGDTEHKMCVWSFSATSALNISHSKRNSAKYKRKLPVVLSHFNEAWTFIGRYSTNPEISNFMKIRPVGAELLHADGPTDSGITLLTAVFRNYVTAPKNEMGQAWHDLLRREMRTHVSAWGNTGGKCGR